MALVKCPECGREISDRAMSCPGCGVPSKHVENSIYKLSVPQGAYKSSSGTYLRFCGYATWVLGGIAAIVLSLEYRYGEIRGFNFWLFLGLAAVFFVAGLIPICFAQFFDDVHTIRYTLQGIQLESKGEKVSKLEQIEKIALKDNKPQKGQKICPQCGSIINAHLRYCSNCHFDNEEIVTPW